MHPEDNYIMFRAAVFVIAKRPPAIEWDKQIVYSHNGILHHTEKERMNAIPNKKGSHKHNTDCRGAGTKDVLLDDSISKSLRTRKKKSMTLRVKIVVTVRGQWIVTGKDRKELLGAGLVLFPDLDADYTDMLFTS